MDGACSLPDPEPGRQLRGPHLWVHGAMNIRQATKLCPSLIEEIQRRGLTLLGFTDANLSPADTVQQNLPFNGRSQVALDLTVDAVCDRYGSGSIGRATMLGRSSGLEAPILPDPGGAEPTRQHRP
jgi:DNA polymerase-4